jgi:hypothetical protein
LFGGLLTTISRDSNVFRGTKPAQDTAVLIEIIQEFTLYANPHNLKVIGSNPIPATKIDIKNPAISMDCWVFVFKVEPALEQDQHLDQVRTRLVKDGLGPSPIRRRRM